MDACEGCFGQKLSCWMGRMGSQKKNVKDKEASESEDSSGSEENGTGWLKQSSTIKVRPPIHMKVVGKTRDAMVMLLEMRDTMTSWRMMTRPMGVAVKIKIE